MKKSTLLFWCFLTLAAFANAQNELMLHLAPRMGNSVFSLDQAFDHPGGTYQMKYTRFEYYISEISITHDGGQVTPCTGLHLLVRPAIDSMYSLGQMPDVQHVEAISFSVGVDPASNHLDPTSFPPNDPLAPQDPSMQWGWTAGYRFAAIEGEAGANLAQHFEIHALGDANYKSQTIQTNAEQVSPDMKMIHLIANYAQAVKAINLSSGLIVHGTSGVAVTLLTNFKDFVFSAESTSATSTPDLPGKLELSPNPMMANSSATLTYFVPEGGDKELMITDLGGKTLLRRTLGEGKVTIENLPGSGMYFVYLWQNGHPVAMEKLVVLN